MRGVAMAVAMGMALGVNSSLAGETYPTAVRTITGAGATSTCIGDISTPVCALETLLGCFARGDRRLCELAEASSDRDRADQIYRILGYAILRDRDGRSPDRAEMTLEFIEPAYDGLVFFSFARRGTSWFHRASGMDGEWGEEIYVDPNVTEVVESHGRMLVKPPPLGWGG